MKGLTIYLFAFLFASSSLHNTDAITGIYKSKNCAITIELTHQKAHYQYHLKTEDCDKKGIAKIEVDGTTKGYLIELNGAEMAEPSNRLKDKNISFYLLNDTIRIQNYGNAMNEYQQLNSCGDKYIILTKQKHS